MRDEKGLFRIIRFICLVLALVANIDADATLFNKTESWTEDALLHDGRTIEVKRKVDYVMTTSGEISQLFKSWPTTYWLKFKNPDTGVTVKWQGEPHFEPILVDVVNRVPFLVVLGEPDLSNMKKYGCPDIPYIVLRYEEKTRDWIPIQREQIPNELKEANIAVSYDEAYMPQNNYHLTSELREEINNVSEMSGYFQRKIPFDFESWRYTGKLRYRNSRKPNDCRPPRQEPKVVLDLPTPQKEKFEILDTKDFSPEWAVDDWSGIDANTSDKFRRMSCNRLLKPADPNDLLMNDWQGFVNDPTDKKRLPAITQNLCPNGDIWVFEYPTDGLRMLTKYVSDAKKGEVILTKYKSNGDWLFRLTFDRPANLPKSVDFLMNSSLREEKGYVYFDWWYTRDTGPNSRSVQRILKVRIQEPQSRIVNTTAAQSPKSKEDLNAELFGEVGSDYNDLAVEQLLKDGADPNTKNKAGLTPLYYAAQQGATKVAKLLIAYKADINASNNDGLNPLEIAIDYGVRNGGGKGLVEMLVKNGANVNVEIDHYHGGSTPLAWAITTGDVDLVKLFIAHGANVAAVGWVSMLKIPSNTKEIQDLLLAHGAKMCAEC